jgi:site-specific DNA-methyltransferase (adenine-specific)
MADNSVDSIVTDPPYGLAFMGKKWDYDVPSEDVWRECLRVLKPGGHLLAFAGTRTQHRMAVRIEDAGFEIRDMIAWVYGSGFPKSLDVSKAIDKAAGAEREVVGNNPTFRKMQENASNYNLQRNEFITAPATDAARQWDGWGTALKPALEPITVARKPLYGTVAANVLAHGTGALNIDGCRVGDDVVGWGGGQGGSPDPTQSKGRNYRMAAGEARPVTGRWPANLVHDGSEEATAGLGSAARYFYAAKASRSERDAGLEGMPEVETRRYGDRAQGALPQQTPQGAIIQRNHHPTVKPVALMRWLCRLVTPPGGVVLDPFAGSGSTGVAAVAEGFGSILIERDAEYVEIIRRRLAHAQGVLFSRNDD